MIQHMVRMDWRMWLYSLLNAVLGGGASAVVSGFSAYVTDSAHYANDLGGFFRLVGIMFLVNATLSLFFFLKSSPLPPLDGSASSTANMEENKP